MGSAMSAAQEDLLARHFNVVCVMLDGDQAGQEAAKDCVMRLGRRMWVWAPALPEGKQRNMLTAEELRGTLKEIKFSGTWIFTWGRLAMSWPSFFCWLRARKTRFFLQSRLTTLMRMGTCDRRTTRNQGRRGLGGRMPP